MLFKLSIKNIRKSIRDYAVYFFTLIVAVAVFYIFNAIETQSVLLKVTSSTREIIRLMSDMLSGISVFISFVLGFLIIYAGRFLMKRRKREFGIYLTLGMGKRKISMILFLETLLIGIISLGVGLLIGVCVSQFMSIVVANMFEADLTEFEFIVSGQSCIKTVCCFGIIYLVVMLFHMVIISRYKLIDLLQAGKKTEKIRLKNPALCTIVFLIASAILGYAYYLVTAKAGQIEAVNGIFLPIFLGVLATFLIFWSLSGLLLKLFMSMKKIYYRGLNSFTLRQISSKINTTVVSMTVICLMLFLTICILSCSVSIRNSLNHNLTEMVPVDLQLQKPMNLKRADSENQYSRKQLASSGLTIGEVCRKAGYDIEAQMEDKIQFYLYEQAHLTLKSTLGKTAHEATEKYPFLQQKTRETIMRLSDYNRVAKLFGQETYTLEENQYLVVADLDAMAKLRSKALKEGRQITVSKTVLKPKYSACKKGFIIMAPQHVHSGIFIVPDAVVADKDIVTDNLVGNYREKNPEKKQQLEEDFLKTLEKAQEDYLLPDGNTKISLYEGAVGLGAMASFIGLYLGMIFLISGAAILALKELSESADNIERYVMLRKLGADEKTINRALFAQIGIFFLFPLLLAAIHSVFGIRFAMYLVEPLIEDKLIVPILVTAGIIAVIYGGYFIITYLCSKNIIKK